jgi:hypothetical protein
METQQPAALLLLRDVKYNAKDMIKFPRTSRTEAVYSYVIEAGQLHGHAAMGSLILDDVAKRIADAVGENIRHVGVEVLSVSEVCFPRVNTDIHLHTHMGTHRHSVIHTHPSHTHHPCMHSPQWRT